MEGVVSNAEQRALRLEEEEVVPRIGDLYAALPSITGKLELEYEGEMHGPEKISRELISAASGLTYEFRAGGMDVDEIVEYFEEGGALQVSPDASAAACIEGFHAIPGLLESVVGVGLVSAASSFGFKAAACELVLEALVADRRISRTDGGYKRALQEGPGGKGHKGFDPFGS